MTTIQIEKNVPLPGRQTTSKYPFKHLDVGESFAVPADGSLATVRSRATKLNKTSDKLFTVRQTGSGGHGVWRLK